jgi:hypothetical protein
VVEAWLSPFQLVFLGTAQGITQMLWGLGWTFSAGADVAWLTDELDQPERVAGVLTASARWEQVGAAGGLVSFGALAWATDLAASMVVAGLAMWLLGLFVAVRFTEHHFRPALEQRWRRSLSLRIVDARIDGAGAARRIYAAACSIGALGLLVLACARESVTGMAGVLLAGGIAWTVTRTVSVIWANRRTTSDVRATLQSFLSQAEYPGEIVLGLGLGILAQETSIPTALLGSCALVAGAAVLVTRSRAGDTRSDETISG